jgi:hypothetical protein
MENMMRAGLGNQGLSRRAVHQVAILPTDGDDRLDDLLREDAEPVAPKTAAFPALERPQQDPNDHSDHRC